MPAVVLLKLLINSILVTVYYSLTYFNQAAAAIKVVYSMTKNIVSAEMLYLARIMLTSCRFI
jgi:hypothetical protein